MEKIEIRHIMRVLGLAMALLSISIGVYVLFGYIQLNPVCITIYPTPLECLVPRYGYEYLRLLQAGASVQVLLALVYSGLALSEYVKIRTKVNKNEKKDI
jgi:hypothetical protein